MSNKITIKQWEDYIIITTLLLGWEEYPRWGQKEDRGPRWRRAQQYLEDKKGMHVCVNGQLVEFIKPNPQK